MFGRETYTKLERRVPRTMQGLRLAERRSPQSIRQQAEAERAVMPHPILGRRQVASRVGFGYDPTNPGRDRIPSVPRPRTSYLPFVLFGAVILWGAK